MRRTLLTGLVVLGLSVGVAGTAVANSTGSTGFGPGTALKVVGLTVDGQRLVAFRSDRPVDVRRIGKVSGLSGDSTLVGIDYRVQDGKLYGVGNQGGVYTVSTRTAYATKVSQLTVALNGVSFGVDFNPAANRLRVISDTGQNLRHNIDDAAGTPAAGTTATDTGLTNPPVPPAPAATATGVSGAAYTNNDLSRDTVTTLFDIDTTLDQVSVQSPANNGTLAPAGKLGLNAEDGAGVDIYTKIKAGVATDNTAFAALKVDGTYRFYGVSVLTGRASLVGTFPARTQVVDIALPLNQ